MSGKKPSVALNFLMNTILKMSAFLFPLITFPYVSRVLEADGYGKVQMALSVLTYFSLLTQLGIPTYGVRACAVVRDDREKLSRTVHELLSINVLMMVISYAVFFALLLTVPKFQQEKPLYLVASLNIILAGVGMEWMYGGLEQYSYIAIRSMVFKLISVVAMFLLVHAKEDYVIYAGITVGAAAGSNVLNLINARKYISCRFLGNYNIKRHIKPVLVFFAMSCATTIYTNLDSVMLGFLATDTDVGYYAAAVKIKHILVSLITALGTVLLPRVSYYIKQDQMDKFWNVLRKSLRFTLCAAIPFTVFFIIFAKNGIFFLSGDGYVGAIVPMQIIMPTLIFIGLGSVIGLQTLVPLGKEHILLWSYIAGAVVDCISNALLIPKFQAAGAACSSLLAEITVSTIQAIAALKLKPDYFRSSGIGKIALACIAGAAASFWVPGLALSEFYILALGAILFFAAYVLVLQILKDSFLLEIEGKAFGMLKSKLKK